MVPLQYIVSPADIDSALATGCHWLQLNIKQPLPAESIDILLKRSHAGGAYLVLTDDVELCSKVAADGVVLTIQGITDAAKKVPEPTGIVLQRPRPITLAISEARRMLGEESPQFVGVVAETPEDCIAAAKAGADFIQVPASRCVELLQAVRARSFTTPVVALGAVDADSIPALLDEGISGLACTIEDVPPVMIPLLLNADE